MTTRISRTARWALTGAALLLVASAAVWVVMHPGSRGGEPGESGRRNGEIAGEMDGMDMSGMQMGGEGTVRIEPRMARSLGVTVATVELGALRREIRATGNVTFDETRLSTITPKFGGFVERLHVEFTGQAVRAGQPLLDIYSPELVSAQEELLAALRLERRVSRSGAPGVAARSAGLVESARRRLLLWDISAAQIEEIEGSGEVRRTLTLHAPSTGFVVEKSVQVGQSVQPGAAIYRLADLSRVWVDADVYERDVRFVQEGEPAEVEIGAFPGERFSGVVSYIHPEVRRDSRTVRVRVELANPGGRIKPGMFATVRLDAPVAERAVLVPRDAVMRTGEREVVFVEEAPGLYEVRAVRAGADADGRTQILSGLLVGERVVSRANFILDAESRLMETMMGMPDMPGMDMDLEMEMDAMGMDDERDPRGSNR